MTADDYQLEQDLRARTREKGAHAAAAILADFYEQRGQLSRTLRWRQSWRVHAQRRPADLIAQDLRGHRQALMWLLSNSVSQAAVARLFRSSVSRTSTLIRNIERGICIEANEERHYPTMAATLRLQAVGALPPRFERGTFELGDVPPESWPQRVRSEPLR